MNFNRLIIFLQISQQTIANEATWSKWNVEESNTLLLLYISSEVESWSYEGCK